MGAVYVRLAGGLGNQLFQLAAATRCMEVFGIDELYLSLSALKKYAQPRRAEALILLEGCLNFKTEEDGGMLPCWVLQRRLARLVNLSLGPLVMGSQSSLFESHTFFERRPKSLVMLDGYFQDCTRIGAPVIVEGWRRVVQARGRSVARTLGIGDARLESLVAVHVRRGDYLNVKNSERYRRLDLDYYRKAMEVVDCASCVPIIFSDDRSCALEYSKELNGICGSDYGLELADEFALMSSCARIIGANSTFSWWAAYLSASQGVKCIFPREWYVGGGRPKIPSLGESL